jgi:Protein of unknown function (DUF1573)
MYFLLCAGGVSAKVSCVMKHIFKIAAALFTLTEISGSLPVLGQLPAGPASAAKPNADGPRIAFSETVFDFGKIKSGEPVRHEFIATNTGNAVLEITMVQPGCPGCTTALPWDRQIQPGQTGKIPIQFNPLAFSGPVGKSVTVTCNDPAQPSHVLQFRANVWQPIDVQPSYLYFMPAEGEETNETKVVRIISNLDEPLTLGQPQCDNPAFKLELKTLKAGKEFELHVSHGVVTSNAAPQGLITISTTSSNAPAVRVTTRVMPQPAMAVSPLQIMLPAGSLSAGHRHTQMIRNNSSVPMKVTEAAVNAEGVTVQVNESQPGKLFLLTVNFPANFQVPAGVPLALTVKTTHPRRPIIRVPVVQSATPAPAVFRPPATAPAGSK